jgi:hypothetical protein
MGSPISRPQASANTFPPTFFDGGFFLALHPALLFQAEPVSSILATTEFVFAGLLAGEAT